MDAASQQRERVVIVGGGVGGLAAALALGRAGHAVTLLERDELPTADDAASAFETSRRGAPQAHQTHGFLARVVVVLRERFPDVYDDLMAAGCFTMPGAANLGEPQPGDEDLRVMIVRRTTFEWVLRRAALRAPGVEVIGGADVRGLLVDRNPTDVPRVCGVTLDDGTAIDADVVVASTGRRGAVPRWLAEHGVDVPETVRESGLMYLTRWYRLPADAAFELDPKLGGDLGFVKFLAVPGDGETLSVTLAIRPEDTELRSRLSQPEGFDLACRLLPGPDRFFADGPLEPIGGVRPMGGLLNRLRRFTDDDGRPTVLGFHAVGDAHTCTNPLYGRGCALALVQATELADAMVAHPGDPVGRARTYEAACAAGIEPWYHASVEMDAAGADPARGADNGQDNVMARVFNAAQTDPVLGRALGRYAHMLINPAELAGDVGFLERSAIVAADPETYPMPPRLGPTKAELVESLDALAAPADVRPVG